MILIVHPVHHLNLPADAQMLKKTKVKVEAYTEATVSPLSLQQMWYPGHDFHRIRLRNMINLLRLTDLYSQQRPHFKPVRLEKATHTHRHMAAIMLQWKFI